MTEAQALQLLADLKEAIEVVSIIGLALAWAHGFNAGQQR